MRVSRPTRTSPPSGSAPDQGPMAAELQESHPWPRPCCSVPTVRTYPSTRSARHCPCSRPPTVRSSSPSNRPSTPTQRPVPASRRRTPHPISPITSYPTSADIEHHQDHQLVHAANRSVAPLRWTGLISISGAITTILAYDWGLKPDCVQEEVARAANICLSSVTIKRTSLAPTAGSVLQIQPVSDHYVSRLIALYRSIDTVIVDPAAAL